MRVLWWIPCAIAIVGAQQDPDMGEVRLSIAVDDRGTEKPLMVKAGDDPAAEATKFCRMFATGAGWDQLTCVKELSKRVTVERVRAALPVDAPLTAVSVEVAIDKEGNTAVFEHVEGQDIGAEAETFCEEVLLQGAKNKDPKVRATVTEQCAGRLIAAARKKLIEQAVESEEQYEQDL